MSVKNLLNERTRDEKSSEYIPLCMHLLSIEDAPHKINKAVGRLQAHFPTSQSASIPAKTGETLALLAI